jgi:ABC-2 type transport system permease protein
LETCLGMVGFWFLEVNSLLFVYMLFNYFLSGQMFPLELFDKVMLVGGVSLGTLVRLLPFQYLCYFPCMVFLGKVTGPALIFGVLAQFAWVAFFVYLAHWQFNRGVRRYSAFGG